MTMALILDEDDRRYLQNLYTDYEEGPVNSVCRTGELYETYGATKGYLNGAILRPAQRIGGSNGNPDPCYVLGAQCLVDPNFATAQAYMSGLPQKSTSDPGFPPPLEDE